MRILNLSLPSPTDNLALDEALLDACESGEAGPDGVLRFWESPVHFAVLGYSDKAAVEVRTELCRRDGVPVLRRCSGGGAVLQGPGCLNYSLVLPIPKDGPLRDISRSNGHIMGLHTRALTPLLGPELCQQGLSDLALGNMKISGNAQRRRRRFLLFHGTLLHDFNLPLIERFLPMPIRQPDYRKNRSHLEFLTNVPVSAEKLKKALADCWGAKEQFGEIPWANVANLVAQRYGNDDWNLPGRPA